MTPKDKVCGGKFVCGGNFVEEVGKIVGRGRKLVKVIAVNKTKMHQSFF